MVQPNYNPEEALQRVKLMMGYDSSKTLTENKQAIRLVSEQFKMDSTGNPIDEPNTEPEMAIVKLLQKCSSGLESTGGLADTVISELAGKFNQAFNYSFLGTGMGTDDSMWKDALKKLANSVPAGNFGDLCALKKEFEENDFGDFGLKLVEELDDEELSEVMTSFLVMVRRSNPQERLPVKDAKFSSIQYFEKEFACVFQSNSNVDMKVLKDRNNYTYIMVKGKSGTTFKLFYDGRIKKNDDSLTGKKLVCSGGKPTIIGESVEKKKLKEQFDDSDLAPKPSPTQTQRVITQKPKPKPKFPPCENGRYVIGCSSEVVRQVQECLGFMVVDQDGKFGKITQAALQKLGFAGGFTDKDVEKICKKVEEDPSLSVADSFGKPDINPGS